MNLLQVLLQMVGRRQGGVLDGGPTERVWPIFGSWNQLYVLMKAWASLGKRDEEA